MKTWKKALAGVLAMGVCCSASVALTAAYLTDRDSEANVFTVGDVSIELEESFENEATLLPGVDIEKAPVIKNTGKNDAYVWMTLAVPAALDVANDATHNPIHWNWLGLTSQDSSLWTQERYQKALDAGYITSDITLDEIKSGAYWNIDGTTYKNVEIDGKYYHLYTFKYNDVLEPTEVTVPSLVKVYMDAHIDIDPNGDWYHVLGGVVGDKLWNVAENGKPIIYVSAYGIQKDSFDTFDEAYAAYYAQWGTDGAGDEYGSLHRIRWNC